MSLLFRGLAAGGRVLALSRSRVERIATGLAFL